MQQSRGYQGLACQCSKCQSLTPEERQAKQERVTAARRQGGRTRAAQESMQEARSAGFWRTMETHPFFARKWLRRKIKRQNSARAVRSLIASAERPTGRRRPMNG